jgi:hypothetical protein
VGTGLAAPGTLVAVTDAGATHLSIDLRSGGGVVAAPLRSEEASPVCSAKGCREGAAWLLAWNNPKLHTPDRRKLWTACDQHLEQLRLFLDTRGFLREVHPADGAATRAG